MSVPSASVNSRATTTGRFAKNGGNYRAVGQELELEFLPAENFRIEMGTSFAAHDINGVIGFDDRRQLSWQGVSVDFRYRFLDRDTAPFGLTLAFVPHADRVDETTAAVVRNYGTEFTLAVDREVIPNVAVAAINLTYQPEWTRFVGTGAAEQESTVGAAFGLMAQVRPGIFLGGEARYFRKYDGIGLDELAGQALADRPHRVLPALGALAVDRKLERSGLGPPGRIECGARSRQFRAPSGAAGVRRQFLGLQW